MSLYITIKESLIKPFLKWRNKLIVYNKAQRSRYEIKETLRKYNFPNLSKSEKRDAKLFFKSKGYKLRNTYWHQYNKGITGHFKKDFIPGDMFRSKITHNLNQMRQWPALMDKNLYYHIFHGFTQPRLVASNINGFFYIDDKLVDLEDVIENILKSKKKLIIKPSIWTGQGKNIVVFLSKEFEYNVNKVKLTKLLESYNKDFLVQECVDQNILMRELNPSSLNTLRIMSYLKEDKVHILGSMVRIGKTGNNTDNFSTGGIICGINNLGKLNSIGYDRDGSQYEKTISGLSLGNIQIPSYNEIIEFVKELHERVPYFQIISWDIGLNMKDSPVFIEYNTYTQDSKVLQLVNGTLFGDFTDEILALGLEPN